MSFATPPMFLSKSLRKSFFYLLRLKDTSRSKTLKRLIDTQKLPYNEIIRLNSNNLQNLLNYAYSNVPYYHNLFQKQKVINSSNSVEIDQFDRIPLLDRETLIQQFDNLKSTNLSSMNWFYNTSGGSTGIPVKIIQDNLYACWRDSVKMLFDQWAGFYPGDKKIHLWGSERDIFEGTETFKNKLIKWIKNVEVLNAFLMTPDTMRRYVEVINRIKPRLIHAYAESIYEFARFIKEENLNIYPPHSIISSAGTLFPEMKEDNSR